MQIAALYSHLNGEEYLIVHRPALWKEVQSVIAEVDAESCRTKVSQEKRKQGRTLYSPKHMNRAFKIGLEGRGWSGRHKTFWVTSDEVQFGKYSFVAHDLFVKHLSFYVSDMIDVGIEILPMKELERDMSSGVPYYERDLLNVIRQGRGVPAVPLVLIGVTP